MIPYVKASVSHNNLTDTRVNDLGKWLSIFVCLSVMSFLTADCCVFCFVLFRGNAKVSVLLYTLRAVCVFVSHSPCETTDLQSTAGILKQRAATQILTLPCLVKMCVDLPESSFFLNLSF